MKEDLVDLLSTLAGYQPHSYLTNKIVSGIKGLKDVWIRTCFRHWVPVQWLRLGLLVYLG